VLTFRGFRVGPTASATTWTLAVIYADGIDANLDQVRNGFAWSMRSISPLAILARLMSGNGDSGSGGVKRSSGIPALGSSRCPAAKGPVPARRYRRGTPIASAIIRRTAAPMMSGSRPEESTSVFICYRNYWLVRIAAPDRRCSWGVHTSITVHEAKLVGKGTGLDESLSQRVSFPVL
jgi:hypothetical protein